MGSRKRSDTATSADWGFLEVEGAVEALTNQARYWAMRYGVEGDDLFQEGALFLSVRPERVTKLLALGGPELLAYDTGLNCMKARAEVEKKNIHDSYDPWEDEAWQ